MKNLPKNKKLLIGVGVIVLLVVVLLASGILKFKVTRTGEEPEQVSEPTRRVGQRAELVSKETTFEAADGKVKMSIKLPVGWSVGSHEQLDFVAASLVADKLKDGGEFRANLNVTIRPHPKEITSFGDYESLYKDSILKQYPSMDEISNYSTKFDGVDVNVLEVRNSRPDGQVVRQTAYLFYLNDDYFAVVWIAAAEEKWDSYSSVLNDSVRSLKLETIL